MFCFQPINWEFDIKNYEIHIWALDSNNDRIFIRLCDYFHYIYLRLPIDMPQSQYESVINFINDFGQYEPEIVSGNTLYYYGGEKNFVKLRITSNESFTKIRNLFTGYNIGPKDVKIPGVSKVYRYELCNAEVDYIVKYLGFNKRHCNWYTIPNKFQVVFHSYEESKKFKCFKKELNKYMYAETFECEKEEIKDILEGFEIDRIIPYCGENVYSPEKLTDCKREYKITLNDLKIIENKNNVCEPIILAFDIETYSSRAHDHPGYMPDMQTPEDIIFAISYSTVDTMALNQETKARIPGFDSPTQEGILLVVPLDKQEQLMQVCNENENLKNYKISFYTKEHDLLDAFFKLIKLHNPHVITGYNHLGYDWPTIIERWQSPYCNGSSIPNLSHFLNYDKEPINMRWTSKQGKSIIMNYPSMPGKVHLDLLPIMRQELRLNSYKLDDVAAEVLGKHKVDVSYNEMFNRYYRLLHEDTEQAINDFCKVIEYSAVDSSLVIDIFMKRNCWSNIVVSSNILYVTPEQLYTRGTQVSNGNLISARAINEGYMINKYSVAKQPYAGAIVVKPTPGRYHNILCYDFTSLYPSIIRAYNICWSSLVPPGRNPDSSIYEEFKIDDPSGRKNTYRFVKGSTRHGILPRHVESLVNERNAVRKKQGVLKNKFKEIKELNKRGGRLRMINHSIFDAELIEPNNIIDTDLIIDNNIIRDFNNELVRLEATQISLKVCANSAYGLLGVQEGGKLPLREGAETITYMGRVWIQRVNAKLKDEFKAKIVYGDTDSTMFDIGIKDPKECDKKANEIIGHLNAMFPPPMKLEYEKAMGTMICLGKKTYMAYLLKDGIPSGKPMVKGVLSARRNNCAWQRDVYSKVSRLCLDFAPFADICRLVAKELQDLLDDKVNPIDLVLTTTIKDTYKSASCANAVFKKKLESEIGVSIMDNMRIEYVYVNPDSINKEGDGNNGNNGNKNKYKNGDKMMLLTTYKDMKEAGVPVKIDYKNYIDFLKNAVDSLIFKCYKNIFDRQYIGYGLKFKNHCYHISNPIAMLERVVYNSENPNLIEIMDYVLENQNELMFSFINNNDIII